jgi:putative FmdB family regulatory protein
MPVYEYQCQACHQEFEYQQRMSDPDKTTCEACGGSLERLISRTAFQLKGSGWYKDLYSSQKPAAADGKAGSGTEASGSADKGGSTDKPAASSGGSSSGSGSPSSGSSGGSSSPPPSSAPSSGGGAASSGVAASKAS